MQCYVVTSTSYRHLSFNKTSFVPSTVESLNEWKLCMYSLCINNINNVSMWICGRVMLVMAMATFNNLWKVCGMSKEPLCWLLRIKEYYRIFSSCWSRSCGAWPACSCSCSCGRVSPRRCGSSPRPPPAAHPGTGPRPPHHWPGSQHQDPGSAWSHSACNVVSVILQFNLQHLHIYLLTADRSRDFFLLRILLVTSSKRLRTPEPVLEDVSIHRDPILMAAVFPASCVTFESRKRGQHSSRQCRPPTYSFVPPLTEHS